MNRIFFFVIFILIVLESCLYKNYPYNALVLSFLGYLAYKNISKALWWTCISLLVIGVNKENILFFLFYLIVMHYMYKHMAYKLINLFFISLLETLLFAIFLYLFKIQEILYLMWIKEVFFIFFYNIVFYYYENGISDRWKNENKYKNRRYTQK